MNLALKISRPRFWIYLIGPFILGLTPFLKEIIESHTNIYPYIVWLIVFSLPANLFIYGINDIFDFETDKLNPKKEKYEALLKERDHNKIAVLILITFFLPVLLMSINLNGKALILLSLFIATGSIYSIPPIKAKSKPFFDSFISGLIYILPGFFIYSMITNNYPTISIFLSSLFWSMAMHAFSAIPDIESDRLANLKTIATSLDKRGTSYLCIIFYALSAILMVDYLGIISFLLVIPYLIICYISATSINELTVFNLYKKFPTLNTVIGFILFLFILIKNF